MMLGFQLFAYLLLGIVTVLHFKREIFKHEMIWALLFWPLIVLVYLFIESRGDGDDQ